MLDLKGWYDIYELIDIDGIDLWFVFEKFIGNVNWGNVWEIIFGIGCVLVDWMCMYIFLL